MKFYFNLQYKRFRRLLEHLGINLFLGIILGLACFFILSSLLFFKLEYANWIYLDFALIFIFKLTDSRRNNLQKLIFSKDDFFKIRLVENSIVAIPFFIYLLFELEFLVALILLLAIPFLAFLKFNLNWIKTIPTPFKKFPFEFIVGFRKTFWLLALIYFVIIKAIQVENYELSLFALIVIIFNCLFYYQKPEQEYFVWIHNFRTQEFLRRKWFTLLKCVFILSMIPLIALFVGFPEYWWITIFVYLLGNSILSSIIVAKYSSYPFGINIGHGILYFTSLIIPPLLIFTFILFYKKSRERLEQILG